MDAIQKFGHKISPAILRTWIHFEFVNVSHFLIIKSDVFNEMVTMLIRHLKVFFKRNKYVFHFFLVLYFNIAIQVFIKRFFCISEQDPDPDHSQFEDYYLLKNYPDPKHLLSSKKTSTWSRFSTKNRKIKLSPKVSKLWNLMRNFFFYFLYKLKEKISTHFK